MWQRVFRRGIQYSIPVATVATAAAVVTQSKLPSSCHVPSLPQFGVSEDKKLRRVLVTGGAGFLGSHLFRRLLKEGHDVICLDNFFTGRRQNVSDLVSNPRFELIRHDVEEPIKVECDYVYNLACPASPVHYQYNPIKTTKISFLGTYNMLGLAKRVRARFLQASTSEVYGDPATSPQVEEYWGNVNPIGIRSCYDEGKRVAETLCFDYIRSHNLDVRVARIFNTYGPGMHPYDGRVVSNFIMQALHNEDITIYGDGTQTRSFCFVDDTIDALIRLMEKDEIYGPVNIGNCHEFTMTELAELVIEVTQSKSKIVYLPLPGDDPKQRRPDTTKAKQFLDWEPKTELRQGLAITADYFRKLDLRWFNPPTKHTAHKSTEMDIMKHCKTPSSQ